MIHREKSVGKTGQENLTKTDTAPTSGHQVRDIQGARNSQLHGAHPRQRHKGFVTSRKIQQGRGNSNILSHKEEAKQTGKQKRAGDNFFPGLNLDQQDLEQRSSRALCKIPQFPRSTWELGIAFPSFVFSLSAPQVHISCLLE